MVSSRGYQLPPQGVGFENFGRRGLPAGDLGVRQHGARVERRPPRVERRGKQKVRTKAPTRPSRWKFGQNQAKQSFGSEQECGILVKREGLERLIRY
jgi:hypothetical protein